MNIEYEIVDLNREPGLRCQFHLLAETAWPPFLLQWETADWPALFSTFAEYQLAVRDPAGAVLAAAHTVPLAWTGRDLDLPSCLDEITSRAVECIRSGCRTNTLCALAAIVHPERRGQGMSVKLIQAMTRLAARRKLGVLIAPVRPTWKTRYPLMRFSSYVEWRRPDGAPYDPWLRVHWRVGGKQLRIAENAVIVRGTISDWERWTGMVFPETGNYVISGGLEPVTIDCERNLGCYVESNLWVSHAVH